MIFPYLLNSCENWGAVTKSTQLKVKYEKLYSVTQFIQPQTNRKINFETSSTHSSTQSTTSAPQIDFMSAIKSSQLISEEINLDIIMKKSLQFVMENAGADRGILVIFDSEKKEHFVRTIGNIINNNLELKQVNLHLNEYSELPKSVFHYVDRSSKSIILVDAMNDKIYKKDEYIVQNKIKSILCMKLFYKGKESGIIYLENRLNHSVFTIERIEIITVLLSQTSISIENAKLYDGLIAYNKASQRFIPKEFLSTLGHSNILNVKLGDNTEKEMSILFSDIRSFTELSETMSPSENFSFLNAYLKRMEPCIINNNGFIDKFIGDAVMALFDKSADDAVRSAIDMQKQVSLYNIDRAKAGYKSIQIGIGIHTGKLILGMIGGENRMDGTVISDSVNLASRIESLTKYYGAGIIISEQTFSQLKNENKYKHRVIDYVKVKGKQEPVTLVQIYNDLSSESIEKIEETRQNFEMGINCYLMKEFEAAIVQFDIVQKIHPEDKVATIYLQRCQKFIETKVPENWDGVFVMDSK